MEWTIEDEVRQEQAVINRMNSIPPSNDQYVARYWKGYDCPDEYTCDVVYIDRTTGNVVLRYDGADPANTRFDYGAIADCDRFARKGRNIKEVVPESECVVSIADCRQMMNVYNDDYY